MRARYDRLVMKRVACIQTKYTTTPHAFTILITQWLQKIIVTFNERTNDNFKGKPKYLKFCRKAT